MSLRYVSRSPFIAAVMCVAASASLAACGDAGAPGELAGGDAEELAAGSARALSVPLDIDTQRSLILTKATDPLTVSRFPLDVVLNQLITKAGTGGQQTALTLYNRWWDYFNRADVTPQAARFTDVPHCSDQANSDGFFTLNGYRIQCPRREGRLAWSNPFDPSSPDFVEPLAVVNRFDLVPEDGAHCGEYRIVYGKKSGGQADRNLIILEGQLPNPHPECGIAACLPVAEFWARLPTLSAAERAQEVERFFIAGLSEAGFGPVLHPDNYADAVHGPAGRPGTGQIRTNQFMGNAGAPTQVQAGQDWGLREFKLAKVFDGPNGEPRLYVKPVPVKENPFAELFGVNFDPNDPRQQSFMNDFTESVDKLTTFSPDINDIKLKGSTQALYNAGESLVKSDNDYALQLEPPFNFPWNFELRDRINAELVRLGRDTTFSAWDVAARATTQSCAGCHQLSDGQPLGNGVTWPRKEPEKPVDEQEFRFVHVREDGELSQALTHSFLPHRDGVLKAFLAAHADGNTCSPASAAAASASAAEGDEPVPTLGGSTTH
ncbi:hypothetical protein [Sorangium sp. So ce131]|uniref:hypothetical protein n=1 Tax=Sorangium sp. So ce131 TaxID=3133282 RepID=UPI003F63327A